MDIVANYRNIEIGNGTLNATLAANFNKTEITNEDVDPNTEGLQVEAPGLIGENGYDIFNRKEQSRIESSRPQTKMLLGLDYQLDKFNVALNNTYFGKTTFQQGDLNENIRTEFIPKIVTDLGINYNATEKFTIALNINNILNVLPEWKFVANNATGQGIIDALRTAYINASGAFITRMDSDDIMVENKLMNLLNHERYRQHHQTNP